MKRVVCLQTMGQNDQNQNVETLNCSWRYKILTQLPEIMKQYNNTKLSSIKMTPTEASDKKNQGLLYFN